MYLYTYSDIGDTLVAMRKVIVGSLLSLLFVLTMAAPALAIRDPFDPVISQAELTGSGEGTGASGDGSTGDGTGTDGDGTGTTGDGDDVVAGNSSEGLANTGADTEAWLVAAYALIAVGLGAVVVSKVNGQPA
jgi:hypothetical protein